MVHSLGCDITPKVCINNYRPVSLTSIDCKIMESIVRDSIIDDMQRNNLLNDMQCGFFSGKWSIIHLLKVVDECTQILDEGGSIAVTYMDFMKVFDMMPHKWLLEYDPQQTSTSLAIYWANRQRVHTTKCWPHINLCTGQCEDINSMAM